MFKKRIQVNLTSLLVLIIYVIPKNWNNIHKTEIIIDMMNYSLRRPDIRLYIRKWAATIRKKRTVPSPDFTFTPILIVIQ